MTGRIGRAATVCGVLGVWWWASVRLAWTGVGCADRGCLVPSIAVLVVISLAGLAGAAYALDRVDVRPGRRVALVAAGTFVVIRIAGEAVPSWTSTLAHVLATGAAFAAAGALAALMTEPRAARGARIAAITVVAALIPAALAAALALYDL
ncbi:hypothetical protein [Nonomuraea salmonea]|uniref:Uncharacterized protein n=1 Tax=Nonomuraea salmonea TaxID=46181 RepID=A0ABV5NQI5_9ACTN